MESAKQMIVVFKDQLKGLKIVHTTNGIISDSNETSLTVLGRNGRITVIPRESLLEIKELVE